MYKTASLIISIKNLTITYILVSIVSYGKAQNISINNYAEAKEELFLLKNQRDIIPIFNIGKKELGVVIPSHYNFPIFTSMLEKYTLIDYFRLIPYKGDEFQKWATQKKTIILPVDIEKIDNDTFLLKTLTQIKSNPDLKNKFILTVFSNKKPLNLIELFSDFQTLIYAKRTNKWVPSLVAQSIFGAFSLKNQLGEIQTKGNLRLGYATPEALGMNGDFLNSKIDSIAKTSIAQKAFPGVQILVARKGKVIFHKTYGYHTYENKNIVQKSDIYDFASVSKITTALPALMKLHGEGKFKLDEPFKSYFPKFKKSNKSNLTYREILAHQAGLKPWIPYWKNTIKKNGKFKWRTFKKQYSKRYNVKITDNLFLHRKYKKRIYKAIRKSPVSDKKTYKYSGLAFYLFPEIVSNLTRSDYETYLKKTFYEALGAYSLTYNPTRFFPKEKIIPTERDTFFRNVQIHGTVHDEGAIMMGGVSANAGLFGNANDLAKLMQMYLNGGTYGGQRFIAEASIQEFTKYQYPENKNRRGLGFDKPLLEYDVAKSSVAKDASSSSFGHSGYTGTFVWVDPDHELIFIFFSNRVYPTRNNRKIYQLNIRPSIHQVIYDSMQ